MDIIEKWTEARGMKFIHAVFNLNVSYLEISLSTKTYISKTGPRLKQRFATDLSALCTDIAVHCKARFTLNDSEFKLRNDAASLRWAG